MKDVADTPMLKRSDIASGYVIITPSILVDAVQPLFAARAGSPHHAMIAELETISREFPEESIEKSIKAFLTWTLGNWQVKPRYVVLAGDTDLIPVHMWPIDDDTVASDYFYADIHNCFVPEIIISRIPSSDPVDMRQVCENLAKYKTRRSSGGIWQNRVALLAHQGDNYKKCLDEVASMISTRFQCTKLYGDYTTREEVIDEMNQGVLVANYRGHAEKDVWTSDNGLSIKQIRALSNDDTPPLVFCVCCSNAWIDDPETETIAETFLREGKCVAVIAASRFSKRVANDDFNRYLWQSVMEGGETTPGGIFQRANTLMVQNHENSANHMKTLVMYMLFGDPAAQVMNPT
jgi:hypothetical protein